MGEYHIDYNMAGRVIIEAMCNDEAMDKFELMDREEKLNGIYDRAHVVAMDSDPDELSFDIDMFQGFMDSWIESVENCHEHAEVF